MARRKDLGALLNDAKNVIDDPEGVVTAGGLDGLIEKYQKLKPILALMLPLLAKLPFFAKIAPIIELLMGIADSVTESA